MPIYHTVKVYYYDVNSLYPYIMQTCKLPVGSPINLEGSSDTIASIIKDKNKISFTQIKNIFFICERSRGKLSG